MKKNGPTATIQNHTVEDRMTVKRKKIVIVGLPNTGKSQIYNHLTGAYTAVANYPFTTVEPVSRKCTIDGQNYEIIDTPGLHSLYVHSEEETGIRDMLLTEKIDCIIQCIDANRIKQSLVLTADLVELPIPFVIALTAIDETHKKGMWIDSKELSQCVGVPVIPLNSLHAETTQFLKNALSLARTGKRKIQYNDIIETQLSAIQQELPDTYPHKRNIALLMLLKDFSCETVFCKRYGKEKFEKIKNEIDTATSYYRGNPAITINGKKNQWIKEICTQAIRTSNLRWNDSTEMFAKACRRPLSGIFIALLFLCTTYLLVVHVAGYISSFLTQYIVDPSIILVSRTIGSQFLKEWLIGEYGIITLGLFNALVTVLPILSVFFLMFSFLEDIGYIPTLCILTKRVFEKIGLSGKAAMPMVLAFGCKTMATLVTKGVTSKKEKFIAIYLIAFAIPCSAQLGVVIGILGKFGISAFFIAFTILAAVEIGVGYLLKIVIPDDTKSFFIQDLPPIRIPNITAIVKKTGYRLYEFFKESLPVFIIAAMLLFVVDKTGILDALKVVLAPVVVNWLGLPVAIVDALLLCLARHEAAAGLLIAMVERGAINYIQCIVAVVITTMFVPCFANIVAIFKEMGIKKGLIIICGINGSAFLIAGLVNWFLLFFIGRFQ